MIGAGKQGVINIFWTLLCRLIGFLDLGGGGGLKNFSYFFLGFFGFLGRGGGGWIKNVSYILLELLAGHCIIFQNMCCYVAFFREIYEILYPSQPIFRHHIFHNSLCKLKKIK